MLKISRIITLSFITMFLVACADGGGGASPTTNSESNGNGGGSSSGGGNSGGNSGGGNNGGNGGGENTGGGGSSNNGIVCANDGESRTYYAHQKASGVDLISSCDGAGQKIAILEGGALQNTPSAYKDRIELGIKTKGGDSPSDNNQRLTAPSEHTPHADMVARIAIGNTYGVARKAKAVSYVYDYPNRGADRDHIDLGAIYTDIKNRSVVAINNSWGSIVNAQRLKDIAGYSDAQVEKLDFYRMPDGSTRWYSAFIAKQNGVRRDSNTIADNCSTYNKYIEYLKAGMQVYVDTDPAPEDDGQLITQQELQKIYNIRCKGGYAPEITRAVYEDYIGADFIRKIEADNDNDRDAPIWVWAASNSNEENGSLHATLPSVIKKAEDYWLSVVNIIYNSTDTNAPYKIAGDSSQCGLAHRYYLGAVSNSAKYRSNVDNEERQSGGTSGAAPNVTAGLAVIKQKFPSKDRRWARKRMLATASHTTADNKQLRDKDGNVVTPNANGYSDVFGRGIMRLDLATKPLGASSLSVSGASLGKAQTYLVRNSVIKSSPVFGDGIKNGLSTITTKKFDSMGAEFDYNMGDKAYTTTNATVSTFFNFDGKNISYTPTLAPIGNSKLAFVDTKPHRFKNFTYTEQTMPFMPQVQNQKYKPLYMSYAYGTDKAINISIPSRTDGKQSDSMSLQFVYGKLSPTRTYGTTHSVGLHTEQGTVLGSTFQGAYGGIGRTNTAYVTRTTHRQWGDWNVRYNSVFGATTSNGVGGRSIQNISGILSSSFSMIAEKQYNTGQLGFALYQPLRVEKGSMDVSFVSRVYNNTMVSYDTKAVNITPSGRQVSFEAYYDFANSPFTVKTHFSKDKHHIKGNDDTTVLLRYFKAFK